MRMLLFLKYFEDSFILERMCVGERESTYSRARDVGEEENPQGDCPLRAEPSQGLIPGP